MMIERDDRGGIAVLRLAHGKANALDTPFCKALHEAVDRVAAEDKALVMTGTGSIFSAGVDLKRLSESSDDEMREFLHALDRCFEALFRFPMPSVAAINGHAIAGGHVLAACCDYRVMADGKGRIGVPELKVGVPFPPAALEATLQAVPARDHTDALLRGILLSVDDAAARGWIHETASPESVVDRAVAVASEMAAAPAVSLKLTKGRMRAGSVARIEQGRDQFEEEIMAAWCGESVRGALRDYVAKTLS